MQYHKEWVIWYPSRRQELHGCGNSHLETGVSATRHDCHGVWRFIAIRSTHFTGLGSALPFGFATAGFLVGALTFLIGVLVIPVVWNQDPN